MRIIKMGEIEETELKCSNCGTTFAYNKYDTEIKYGNWIRTGSEDSEKWVIEIVRCPICDKKIEINSEKEYY